MLFVFALIMAERRSRRQARYHQQDSRSRPLPGFALRGWRAALAFATCAVPLSLGFLLPVGQLLVWAVRTAEEMIDEQFLELTSYHGDAHQPYYVHVSWGAFNFRGVRTKADVKYTLFDRAGEPLRATLAVSFREALPPDEVTSEENDTSPDLYQTWQVAQGETLDHIAHVVYGDSGYWRPLAEANTLTNPLELEPGAVLVLPPKER